MRNRLRLAAALAFIQSVLSTPLPITAPEVTAPAAAGGSGPSGSGMISADNRWVVFASAADDLVTNDFNAAIDVFAWDVQTKKIVLLSAAADGKSANGDSVGPVISTNGQYVLFTSRASNLMANDTNNLPDIFVRDLEANTILPITVNAASTGAGSGAASNPLMSADGTRIVFESTAEDLVVTESNRGTDLFMRDLREQRTYLITSPVPEVAALAGQVYERVISADGRRVAYAATMSNLVRNDRNSASDVFLWDGTTNWLVSVSANGGVADGASDSPLISADGRFVAFRSRASNIVPGTFGTNWFVRDFQTQTTRVLDPRKQFIDPDDREPVMTEGLTLSSGFNQARTQTDDGRYELVTRRAEVGQQVYLRDHLERTEVLVSVSDTGAGAGSGDSSEPQYLDAGFRKILFATRASNIASPTVAPHLVIRDLDANTYELVTVNHDGTGPAALTYPILNSFPPSISANGSRIAYQAAARDIVPTTGTPPVGVYVRDLVAKSNILVSVDTSGGGLPNGNSYLAKISQDGRFVIFSSRASNVVPGLVDSNNGDDLFLRNLEIGTTLPLTVEATEMKTPLPRVPDFFDFKAAISADGRYVAFETAAAGLVENDFNNRMDVFVRDTIGGTNILVSVGVHGRSPSTGPSYAPLISGDGRYVAFRSEASELIENGTTNEAVYLRDLQGGTTTVIPTALPLFAHDGQVTILNGVTLGTGFLEPSSFSADLGREAYVSNSGGARSTNSSGVFQVYLHDREHNTTNLVSKNADGPAGWCDGSLPAVSPDGRYVVFESMDGTIVPNDHNSAIDVFIYDSQEDRAELVSRRESGRQIATANGFSWFTPGALTADAQKLAFHSWSTNLTLSDMNDVQDVFVHDFATGSNLVVSAGMSGGTADGFSGDIVISGDGTQVAFSSQASGFMENDTNNVKDVFLRDLQSGAIMLVSKSPAGTVANRQSHSPSISFDGKRIAFASEATDLVDFSEAGGPLEDSNHASDIFLADLETATVRLVTMSMAFEGRTAGRASYSPVISPDGKWIAFLSSAPDLVTNTLSGTHLYLYDVAKRRNTWLGQSRTPAMFSANSRFVVFESGTERAELGDANGRTDIFLFDTQRAVIELVSANFAGTQSGSGHSRAPDITPEGRFVVFYSAANDMVGDDHNDTNDVFLRDRVLGFTTLISRGPAGSGNGPSDAPAISSNGRFIAFRSSASDLTGDQIRAPGQIYSYDVIRGRMRLISRSAVEGGSANRRCGAPIISADGSKVIIKSFATDLALDDSNLSQDLFYVAHSAADIGDEDGDGMDDSWERAHFGGLDEDGHSDNDGDGVRDLDEFLVGTDPSDSSSVFEAESLAIGVDGSVTIKWASVPGDTYIVQYKDDLNESQWTTLPGLVRASSTETEVIYTSEELGIHRYYRILAVQ